ncbi:protein of unknown function [Pseudorhizobium banfieldiae]|uniref:Uncharacterized protein n=1 Tax=Pseudorhizobium banfieldiae TaxID=1125847 RepID=L0NCZ0_9HYPH|nr:protein of unknown function [Pseudorhizobium banfieldiae]
MPGARNGARSAMRGQSERALQSARDYPSPRLGARVLDSRFRTEMAQAQLRTLDALDEQQRSPLARRKPAEEIETSQQNTGFVPANRNG